MEDTFVDVLLDPASLAVIANFSHMDLFLQEWVAATWEEVGPMLVQAAQSNTWAVFSNPTGALADSIDYTLAGPMELILTVEVPYGRRREFGFSGMTDSLGRFYRNDPAKPYMQPALEDNEDQILLMLENAILSADALSQLGGA